MPLFCEEGPAFYAAAFAHNSPFAVAGPYLTVLLAPDEASFRSWVTTYAVPVDPDADPSDYDMRGYWVDVGGAPWTSGHFPDTFKTPYDTTFSAESIYATGDCPFHWVGDELIDSRDGSVVFGECAPTSTVTNVVALSTDSGSGSSTAPGACLAQVITLATTGVEPTALLDALQADVEAQVAADDGTLGYPCYGGSFDYYVSAATGDIRLTAWYVVQLAASRESNVEPFRYSWYFFSGVFSDVAGVRTTLAGSDYPVAYPAYSTVFYAAPCHQPASARPDCTPPSGDYSAVTASGSAGVSYEWTARTDNDAIRDLVDIGSVFPSLTFDFECVSAMLAGTGWYMGLVIITGPPPLALCLPAWAIWHPSVSLASETSAGTAPMDIYYNIREGESLGSFDSIVDMLCPATMVLCDENWLVTNLDWSPIHAVAADLQAMGRSLVGAEGTTYSATVVVDYSIGLLDISFLLQYTISSLWGPGPGNSNSESWMTDYRVYRNPFSVNPAGGSGTVVHENIFTNDGWGGDIGDGFVAYPGWEPPMSRFVEHQTAVALLSGAYDIGWEMDWDPDLAVLPHWSSPSGFPGGGPIGGVSVGYYEDSAHVPSADALRPGDIIVSVGRWTGPDWAGSLTL